MWMINLTLGYIAAILSLMTGAIFNDQRMVIFSLCLACIMFSLNKLRQRHFLRRLHSHNINYSEEEFWD